MKEKKFIQGRVNPRGSREYLFRCFNFHSFLFESGKGGRATINFNMLFRDSFEYKNVSADKQEKNEAASDTLCKFIFHGMLTKSGV